MEPIEGWVKEGLASSYSAGDASDLVISERSHPNEAWPIKIDHLIAIISFIFIISKTYRTKPQHVPAFKELHNGIHTRHSQRLFVHPSFPRAS
jgi:hypothetical protein